MDDQKKTNSLARYLEDTVAHAKLVGKAPCFVQVREEVEMVVHSDAAVLLMGETGTGKELLGRAIHYLSGKASYPFVPLNCGSLSDTLLEDELFGHERGAFTDAHHWRPGLFAQAEHGTLFLDEVDLLSVRAQVVLLRVLQDKKFRPIGASGEKQADVRVVAATNARLDHLVQQGTFREDLYYRLSVFPIHLPPLRCRKDDIAILVAHFIRKHALAERGEVRLTPAAYAAVTQYEWPGNVRELENTIIRGVHRSKQQGWIDVKDLGLPFSIGESNESDVNRVPSPCSFHALKQQAIEKFERSYLMGLMTEHHGNVTRAACAAGKERRTLGRLLKKYQIDPALFSCSTH